MRKVLGLVAILVIGVAIGFTLQRKLGGGQPISSEAARQNVTKILDQSPAKPVTGDTELVRASARIEPSVVNIDMVSERPGGMSVYGNAQQYTMEGKGSGVIISPDGYIVTNNHVVEDANIIRVTTPDGHKYDGHLVGANPDADLAVVKIEGKNLPTAVMGDSSAMKVGQSVIAIGYPLGIGTTVTHGIISAVDRKNLPVGEGRILRQALQTDAPINRGNSGGALANADGQLIGINTAIASENGGGNIGIGFAIPINSARSILKDLINNQSKKTNGPAQPFIGIVYQPLPADIASDFGLQPGEGAVVMRVVPLTPADSAGLKRGDIIVGVDGNRLTNVDQMRDAIVKHGVGGKLVLKLLRGDRSTDDVSVTIGKRPEGLPR